MTDLSEEMPDANISFGDPQYDHQRAAYFIPELDAERKVVIVDWLLRDEWSDETKQLAEFTAHYESFCEPAPSAVFDEPLDVILQFAFNEYESLRTRLGAGHQYALQDVDRISDVGVALRLIQKQRESELEETVR